MNELARLYREYTKIKEKLNKELEEAKNKGLDNELLSRLISLCEAHQQDIKEELLPFFESLDLSQREVIEKYYLSEAKKLPTRWLDCLPNSYVVADDSYFRKHLQCKSEQYIKAHCNSSYEEKFRNVK